MSDTLYCVCPHCGQRIDNPKLRSDAKTPDEIIETYYRRRAAGSKLTIKDLAATSDYAYSWLRKRKMEYDRAGKWGSKRAQKKKRL